MHISFARQNLYITGALMFFQMLYRRSRTPGALVPIHNLRTQPILQYYFAPQTGRFQSTFSRSIQRKRVIVAVTGATGAPLAVELLQRLRKHNVETHLILSKWGASTLKYELEAPKNTVQYLNSLADHTYTASDVSATLSSGSFLTYGMIVVPCSMKTLAGIRIGYDSDLITRAAGVTLKERRKLVLVARETPLSSIHLENMLEVARAGAIVFPPVMAFYTRPKGVGDMVTQSVMRMMDCLDLASKDDDHEDRRWSGFNWEGKSRATTAKE